jgi:myo-inositol-1(or 4)-monophosphatase
MSWLRDQIGLIHYKSPRRDRIEPNSEGDSLELHEIVEQLETVLRDAAKHLTRRLEVLRVGDNPSTSLDHDIHNFLSLSLPRIVDAPVVSEEGRSTTLGRSGPCWIIDPVDGTINAIAGTDDFAFSVSLIDAGSLKPLVGAVYIPRRDHLYVAAAGSSAWLNRVSISNWDPVAHHQHGRSPLCIVSFGVPKNIAGVSNRMSESFRTLLANGWITRQTGSAAIDICRVAAGSWTAFFEYGLMYWDFVAATLIAVEAGCSVAAVPVGHTESTLDAFPLEYDLVVAKNNSHLLRIASIAGIDTDRSLAL